MYRALFAQCSAIKVLGCHPPLVDINNIVYIGSVKSSELKRWLSERGATFKAGKGSHLKIELNGRFAVLPMHGKDLGNLANAIKKQLGFK